MSTDDPAPTCPTCGTSASAGARFCRRCGDPFPGAMPPPVPGEEVSAPGEAASAADEGVSAPDEGASAPGEVTSAPGEAAGAPDGGETAPAPIPSTQPPIHQVPTATLQTDAVEDHVRATLTTDAEDPPAGAGTTSPTGWPPVTSSSAAGTIACPACPAHNPPGRELCVRCGVDLETGQELPQPRPSDGRGASSTTASSTPHRAWWVAPIAIVVVAAAILAALWSLEVGPFASSPELPSATFSEERYAADGQEPTPLTLTDIGTVTTRPPEGERVFPVEQMVDTDPGTAWHSDPGQLPDGVDEKIDLFLEQPAWVSQVILNNGDHHDADAYEASGRLQQAMLVLDGDVQMEVAVLDQGQQPQAITLPEPVLTTTVRLEVVEVVPGAEHDGVALSDLEVRGWVADEEDAELAERRADVHQAAGSFTLPDR